jgi:hypothetical protein
MRNMKIQSSMESLMTYGWALAIIVVILFAIFSLGLLSPTQQVSTECTPTTGFSCSQPLYSHSTGNLSFTFQQSTGSNWATANIYFVPYGTASSQGVPESILNYPASGNFIGSGTVLSGKAVVVYVPISGSVAAGIQQQGSIWVGYQPQQGSQVYYIQVASGLFKSV